MFTLITIIHRLESKDRTYSELIVIQEKELKTIHRKDGDKISVSSPLLPRRVLNTRRTEASRSTSASSSRLDPTRRRLARSPVQSLEWCHANTSLETIAIGQPQPMEGAPPKSFPKS